MKLPQQPTIPNSKDTIFWLKFQSQLADKLKSRENSPQEENKNVVLFLWLSLVKLMCVDPGELHGTSYVSKELAKSALVTASVTTIANWWNAFTTLPFLLFMFESMGIVAWPTALLANVALIKLGNALATGAASKQPISLGFARIGTSGFIALNLILTIVSGVGSELLLNQPGLSRKLGEELVRESVFEPLENELSLARQEGARAIATRQECQRLQRELEKLPPNHPQRNELHLAAYGTYEDRINENGPKSYENKPIEQWPACPKANALEAKGDRNLKAVQEKYQQTLTEVKNHGSYLAYLKKVKPEIYQSRFDETAEIKSGTEATRVAVVSFTDKLFSFQWADLGQSLFVMSVSAMTSTIAILIAISYSNREDVKMSKSSAVDDAKNFFIDTIIADLKHNPETLEDSKLLIVFSDELKRTGRCDYSQFVEYVKHAREVEKSRYLREDLEAIELALEQVKNGCQQLKDSSSDPEIACARNLIHQGSDSIKALTLRYFPRKWFFHPSYTKEDYRIMELIKTVEYVQDYLQHFPLTLPLAPRQIGYLDEVLTNSINLTDRLDKTIHKNYNFLTGNS